MRYILWQSQVIRKRRPTKDHLRREGGEKNVEESELFMIFEMMLHVLTGCRIDQFIPLYAHASSFIYNVVGATACSQYYLVLTPFCTGSRADKKETQVRTDRHSYCYRIVLVKRL
jgi:hypothetical protein